MFSKFKEPDHIVETKAEFIELVEKFIEGEVEGDDCVAVFFDLPNLKAPEIILNPRMNAHIKLDYYAAAYNNDLQLNANNAVRIIGVSFL